MSNLLKKKIDPAMGSYAYQNNYPENSIGQTLKKDFDETAIYAKQSIGKVVSSIQELKAIDKTKHTQVFVSGYFANGDGGGGAYALDAADVASADNSGTIIVGADGGRWKLKHGGEVWAEQFGADPTNNVTASERIQKMIDWCQENDVLPNLKNEGQYKLTSGLKFKHGKSATDTRRFHARLNGNGATLRPMGTFKALHIEPRCLLIDKNTGRGVADISVKGLTIDGSGAFGACQACVIGSTGYHCDNFRFGDIDLIVINYTQSNTVHLIECRHIYFDIVMRSGTLLIEALAQNSFTGDFVFKTFEANGTVANKPLNITAGSGWTNAQCRGIRFLTPTIYGSGTLLSATGNGQVGDIWFISPQMDGPEAPAGECAIELFANQNSQIFQVHIIDPYIVNYKGPAAMAQTNDNATIYQSDISGGGIGLITCNLQKGNAAVYALNCEGFAVESVDFDTIIAANESSSYMAFDGCTNVRLTDNTGTRAVGIVDAIVIGNGDKHTITGNMMNCTGQVVNDYTAGTPKRLVTNNLKT